MDGKGIDCRHSARLEKWKVSQLKRNSISFIINVLKIKKKKNTGRKLRIPTS